ncbi:MAG: cysteine desulfurase family protein [Bacteroidia bacterium]
MKRAYLDNAATTPMAKEVIEAMMPYMTEYCGNPSSVHSYGRTAKNAIEQARRCVANHLNVHPHEIYFTSGGTEADNMALNCAINDLGVTRIITSAIEHHAVIYTAEHLAKRKNIELVLLNLTPQGSIDINHLELLLKENKPTLVSLMHANNEIGNLISLHEIGNLCKKYNAYFHSDTVQTMGHYRFNLKETPIDFIACSAHKFHGPKGVGFLYVNKNVKINPIQFGGTQERNMRGGTENIYGIVGLAKAMDLAYEDLEEHQHHIQGLKDYMKETLKNTFHDVEFNGEQLPEKSLYTVLSVRFKNIENKSTFLFGLDLKGVAVSSGSACSSGSNKESHVLSALNLNSNFTAVRFSFSRYTTKEEIDFAVNALKELVPVTA